MVKKPEKNRDVVAPQMEAEGDFVEHLESQSVGLAAAVFPVLEATNRATETPVVWRKVAQEQGRRAAAAAMWKLQETLNSPASLGPVGRGDQGEPLWPPGWLGSISHSKELAVSVVGLEKDFRGLGVDTELWLSPERSKRVRRRITSEQERAVALPVFGSEAYAVTAIFSAKESVYKAHFPALRRFFGFDAIELVKASATQLHFQVRWKPLRDLCGDSLKVAHWSDRSSILTCRVW